MKSFNDFIINTTALKNNLLKYKNIDGKSKICAVIKADAYGIGIKTAIKTLNDIVDFYAVANAKEAFLARKYTQKSILILNFVPKTEIVKCIKKNISISIESVFQLKTITSVVKNEGALNVHVAVNTNMNRIGFSNLEQYQNALKYILSSKNIKLEGIFTHIYNAKSRADTDNQICIFNQFLNIAKNYYNIDKLIIHATSSFSSLLYKEYRFDMVRLGIMLYGYLEQQTNLKLTPVLTIKSKIVSINKIKKGSSVGYGKVFVAKDEMTIATIPLGYADGINRKLSNCGKVIINGKFCKIVGNICMDMFMCDISNVGAKLYDDVIIIGEYDKNIKLSADDDAILCDTINYEILTNFKRGRFNVIEKK